MRSVWPPVRGDSEVLRSGRSKSASKCGGRVRKLDIRARVSIQGRGWYITDYAKKDSAGRRRPSWENAGRRDEGGDATRRIRETKDGARLPSRATTRRPKTEKLRARSQRRQVFEPPTPTSAATATRPASEAGSEGCQPARLDHRPPGTRELVGKIRPPQREVHDRLQEAELVAGIVTHALDLARVDRP